MGVHTETLDHDLGILWRMKIIVQNFDPDRIKSSDEALNFLLTVKEIKMTRKIAGP